MNWHSLAADALVCVHMAYVLFVVAGFVAILIGTALRTSWVRSFWFRIIHLAMIAIVAVEAVLGIPCPLTVWEHELRIRAGQPVQEASFIGRLVHDLLFFDAPAWVFTLAYAFFGMLVLSTFLFAPPRWPGRRGVP